MARAKQNKIFRTFVKGLMTEASYLTYPEDYSTDELNTIISRKGNRTRRLGIDFENNYVQRTFSDAESTDTSHEYVWQAVNDKAELNLLVHQVGNMIHFWNLEAVPVSDSFISTAEIDLTDYAIASANPSQIRQGRCEFASGKGLLFVVHPYCDPMMVEYDGDDETVSVTPMNVQIRDFIGLDDELANDAEPTTLSTEHWYNLLNQGWLTPNPISPPGGVTPPNQPTYTNPYTGGSTTYRRYNDDNTQIP